MFTVIVYLLLGIYLVRFFGEFLIMLETPSEPYEDLRRDIADLNMPMFADSVLYGLIFMIYFVMFLFMVIDNDLTNIVDRFSKWIQYIFCKIERIDQRMRQHSEAFYRTTVIGPLAFEDGFSIPKELRRDSDLKDENQNLVYRYLEHLSICQEKLPPIFQRYFDGICLGDESISAKRQAAKMFAKGI